MHFVPFLAYRTADLTIAVNGVALATLGYLVPPGTVNIASYFWFSKLLGCTLTDALGRCSG